MIIISYKTRYNKYEDLNITDFEDELSLLFEINEQLEDGDTCVDIIASDESIRYLLSIAMSEFDFAPRKIDMELDNAIYCLELFDDKSLRVFLYDKYDDSLQGTSIYLYQNDVKQRIVDFALNFYSDSDIWLYGYEDEDDDFATGDVSDADIIAAIMSDSKLISLDRALTLDHIIRDLL